MFNRRGKSDPKKEQPKVDRQLKKTGRDLERDKRELEREEKKLEKEINRLAATEKNLTKQLAQLRKQKNQAYTTTSENMQANIKTIGLAEQTISEMNNMLNPVTATFNSETRKKDISKFHMFFNDLIKESGNEEKNNRVIDETRIEISEKVSEAPSPSKGKVGENSKVKTNKDILAQIAKMKEDILALDNLHIKLCNLTEVTANSEQ